MRTVDLDLAIEGREDPPGLAPDHLLPAQFVELLQRPSERTPEQRLMAAVLDEAIRSYCRCAGSRGTRSQRVFSEAAEWFASRDVSWPFAFENICTALALEPDWIRRLLHRWQTSRPSAVVRLPNLRLRIGGSRHSVSGRAPGLSHRTRRAC